jgi:DNA gyrase/topoisomerase IV subunit B
MTKEELQEQLEATNITAITMDGYDEAILGYSLDVQEGDDGTHRTSVAYSYSKCILTLMSRDGMTREEAVDFFEFNTLRALSFVTTCKPIIVFDTEGE